jgi:signal peptidase I
LIWSLDILFFRDRRARAAAAVGKQLSDFPEPGTIDYARSFFPVAVIVLLARAFIFEPFRIPSDSMMPTLLDGDFIVVNKFAYGLRLPVINRKIVEIGEPQRGDVIVFRLPTDPRINYIKRLVGLPGDTVRISNDRLYIDGAITTVVTPTCGSPLSSWANTATKRCLAARPLRAWRRCGCRAATGISPIAGFVTSLT